MHKVIFCRGIQGSGKSTWARQWESEDPENRIIISWDAYRNGHGTYWVPKREGIIKIESLAAFEASLSKGLDICIDNMNLSEKSTKLFLDAINKRNKDANVYSIEYKDFFTPVEECIRRDSLRFNPIGKSVILTTWNKYKEFIKELQKNG